MKVKTTYPQNPINNFNDWVNYIHNLINKIRR